MPSPPIQVFLTTIASQPALRQRQEYLLRILQVKKITFSSYDLASDEDAKRLWKRKAPLDKQQLPGILIGGKFPGTFSDFEEAVEYDELETFLRLKESWNAAIDEDHPALPTKPIGVPGAASPLQMTPEHLRDKVRTPTQSPLKGKGKGADIPVNKREGEFDVSTELSGYGLQGVKVTEQDLIDLVAELGLDGDEAGDLVKGLSSGGSAKKEVKDVSSEITPETKPKQEVVQEKVEETTTVTEAVPETKPIEKDDKDDTKEQTAVPATVNAEGEPKV